MKKNQFIEGRQSPSLLVAPKAPRGFVYTEELKNWEMTKEAPQIFWPERGDIAKGKTRSEDEKYEAKLTPVKTNSSITMCIYQREIKVSDRGLKKVTFWGKETNGPNEREHCQKGKGFLGSPKMHHFWGRGEEDQFIEGRQSPICRRI